MTIKDLITELQFYVNTLGPGVEVEIATSPRKDEWYEIADVEHTTNLTGRHVIVINTD